MEKFVEQTLLYDFYGELLTAHQRRIYEDVVLNDYSLSEVGRRAGHQPSGRAYDNIKRCNKALQDYEAKLHLVEKFVNIKEKVHRIHRLSRECENLSRQELVSQGKYFSGNLRGVITHGI